MADRHSIIGRARQWLPGPAALRRYAPLIASLALALCVQGTPAAFPQPLRLALTPAAVRPADAAASAAKKISPAAPTPAASAAPTLNADPAAAALCSPAPQDAQACTGTSSTLHLAVNPAPLPTGRVGVEYKSRIVLGGDPGYTISVGDGSLPPGLRFTADGVLKGTPTAAGLSRFTVKVTDNAIPPGVAQQTYTLRVAAAKSPARAASASVPASSPAAATSTVTLSPEQADALARERAGPSVSVYRLTAPDLDAIAPAQPRPQEPATQGQPAETQPAGTATVTIKDGVIVEPDPAEAKTLADAAAADAARQLHLRYLRQMLAPMLEVEYPSRALFESALDWQLCTFVRELIAKAGRATGSGAPAADGISCASVMPAPAPIKAASAALPKTPGTPHPAGTAVVLAFAQLSEYVLPKWARTRVLARAEKLHLLASAKPIDWTGGSCGCVHEDLLSDVYGIYPFWASGQPQEVDFSLVSRIGFAALPFDDDGGLQQPANWDAGNTGFVQASQRHGTRLDLMVYRNDWKNLLDQDAAVLQRVARQLARNAVRAADTPLSGMASRLRRYLPFHAEKPAMADGITLYFDNIPAARDAESARRFQGFFRRLMLELITQLRLGTRPYALNVVVADRQIGHEPFGYETLFDYVKRAEEPMLANNRIEDESDIYRSRTNVTVKYLVLLSEPTTTSKKALRAAVENAYGLYGNDRRVLLRKIIPVISYNGANPQQFKDDLPYFRDNFGGVGLWRMPVVGTAAGADIYQALNHSMRKDGAHAVIGFCNWVCTHRWEVRMGFALLVLADLLALAVMAWAGGLRCLGWGVLASMLAVVAATAAAGGSLLFCDTELKALRQGNIPLLALVAALLGTAAYAMLKPRDIKP